MKEIFQVIRLKTLVVSFIPITLGLIYALKNELSVNYKFLYYSYAIAFLIQIATNIFNDLIDFENGADISREDRISSKSREIRRKLWVLSITLVILASGFGLSFFYLHPIYIPIGLSSLFFTYGYTGGPYPLAYNGLGEVFAFIFFGPVITLGSYFAYAGNINDTVIILSIISGLYSVLIIAFNNLRDIDTDAFVGKRTLAVVLKRSLFTHFIVFILFLISYFSFLILPFLKASILFLFNLLIIMSIYRLLNLDDKTQFKFSILSYVFFFILGALGIS